jgi:glycosyl transferase family 25
MSLSETDIEIALLNLDRRSDRMRLMETRLKSSNIKAQRFSAVDGFELSSYRRSELNRNAARQLRPGELGCLLSHRAVWNWAFEIDAKYLWVMEDDVSLGPILQDLALAINKLNEIAQEWQLLHVKDSSSTEFFYRICQPQHISPELDYNNPIVDEQIFDDLYRVGPQIGAHSYVLSRSGIRTCLSAFSTFKNPVDVQLGQLIGIIPTYLWRCSQIRILHDGTSDTQR